MAYFRIAVLLLAGVCCAGLVPPTASAAPMGNFLLRQAPPKPDPKVKEAVGLIAAARKALAQKSYAAAAAGFQKASLLVPKAPGPYLGLAEIAHDQGDIAQEDTYLKQAETVAPRAAITLVARARYLVGVRKYNDALQMLDMAAKADPAHAIYHIQRGDLYLATLHDPNMAIGPYRTAVDLEPDNAAAHFALGSALNAVGRSRDARDELLKATKIDPRNPQGWAALGAAQLNLGSLDDAEAAFGKAVKISPNMWGARIGLGDTLLAEEKFSQSVASYAAAKKLDPTSVLPDIRTGVVYETTGDIENAEKSYRAAIAQDPANRDARNNLAFLLGDQRLKLNEALKLAKDNAAAAPQNFEYQDTLAWVYRGRGELPPALAILQKIVGHAMHPDLYYHLGMVQMELANKKEAIQAFRTAIKIAPNYQPAARALLTIPH